jgi:intracellular septation protein
MSDDPFHAHRAAPKWVRWFVDYAGLVAFIVILGVMKIAHFTDDQTAAGSSWAIVGGSILAILVGLIWERRLAPMPLATAVLGMIFAGLTIVFHDKRFIQVKPTILYTLFALFLLTGLVRGKNPMKVLIGDAFHLPEPVMRILTLRYVLFFFALAALNEAVWRTQTFTAWGFFKFPGTPILIFLFAMSQAPLMMKYMPDEEADEAKAKAKPPTDAP